MRNKRKFSNLKKIWRDTRIWDKVTSSYISREDPICWQQKSLEKETEIRTKQNKILKMIIKGKNFEMKVWSDIGNGNPLRYSCLENPKDKEAWWATVHGVAKSWTRLSNSHSHLKRSKISKYIDLEQPTWKKSYDKPKQRV